MNERLKRLKFARVWLALSFVWLTACGDQGGDSGVGKRQDQDVAFWVWNRQQPLTASELAQLKEVHVKKIYWQIAELELRDGRLVSKARWPLPKTEEESEIDFVPVIRLEASIKDPAKIDPEDLAQWVKKAGVKDSLQFDYDCPNRLLSSYAELLQDFRRQFGSLHLSTTALGAWCDSQQWGDVESAVDAVYPMLYDVLLEVVQKSSRPDQARALLDSAYVTSLIRKWGEATRIPWRVGLPNFTRLSIFREGKTRGHIRSWSLQQLVSNKDLSYEGRGAPGVTFFKVSADTRIGQVAVKAGDWLCLRVCDRESLRQVMEEVGKSSAAGVVWFQMPRAGLASSGWSLAEIGSRFEGMPDLKVRLQDDRLVLSNEGDGDLTADFEQGHELRLSWQRPVLREFVAGDFVAAEFSQNGRVVPAVGALQLKLGFSKLEGGQSVASGLILFRKDKKSLAVKYQIDDSDWKPLLIDR